MADPPNDTPGSDPLGPLVAQWNEAESARAEELEQLLGPIEHSLEQLSEWAERLAQDESAGAAAREEAAKREAAAEERRRLLERDLKLARNRVSELEKSLQDRTEELLRAQAANNALAAELQAVGDDLADDFGGESLDAEPVEIDGAMALAVSEEPAAESAENADSSSGVAERFARLRRTG